MIDKLTDLKLKSLKPKAKPYKVVDGTIGGLHVAVSPTGKRVFRYTYRFEGKEQLLTIGPYPELSLADARELALEAKRQIVQGKNPTKLKKEAKEQVKAKSTTFETVANDWLDMRKPEWAKNHLEDTLQKMRLHILPHIGEMPIMEINKTNIKAILDGLQMQNKFATLKKVRSIISQIYQYAFANDIPGVVTDFTTQFRRQYSNPSVKNRAALTDPKQVSGLMKAIEAYQEVNIITYIALKFSALTFCRPGEIRNAEWTEIDWEHKLWRIPAEKMKAGQLHRVPLAHQTITLLKQLQPITGQSRYLFPSIRSMANPMSEMTVTAALRRMGFGKEEMCAHGFRGMASTLLNEKGCNRDWIERQLAHSPKDKVRAAYNHTDFLKDRKIMMQAWADYLDELTTKCKPDKF